MRGSSQVNNWLLVYKIPARLRNAPQKGLWHGPVNCQHLQRLLPSLAWCFLKHFSTQYSGILPVNDFTSVQWSRFSPDWRQAPWSYSKHIKGVSTNIRLCQLGLHRQLCNLSKGMGDICSNQNGAHEDSTACSPWTNTKLFVSLKQLLMSKASLDRGQAPDFEIELSVVSSKQIKKSYEMSQRWDWHSWHRPHVLCSNWGFHFPVPWKMDDVLVVVSLRLCLNLGQLACGSLALPPGEVQSLKLPSSPRRYALKVCQNARTICTRSVAPNCNRKEIPSKCVRRRWTAVFKQWFLSVLHLSMRS